MTDDEETFAPFFVNSNSITRIVILVAIVLIIKSNCADHWNPYWSLSSYCGDHWVHIVPITDFIFCWSMSSYFADHWAHILLISEFIFCRLLSSYFDDLWIHIVLITEFIFRWSLNSFCVDHWSSYFSDHWVNMVLIPAFLLRWSLRSYWPGHWVHTVQITKFLFEFVLWLSELWLWQRILSWVGNKKAEGRRIASRPGQMSNSPVRKKYI
jgi:hypothetical protein